VQNLEKPCTPWHWVKHTNHFHVIDFVAYGYGLIIIMFQGKGGAKVMKMSKNGCQPHFFHLTFGTTIPS